MSSPSPQQSQSSPTTSTITPQILPTPSSSLSIHQLRKDLEQQLLEKQNQLQELDSGIGKNVLTREIIDLEERLEEFSSKDRLISLEKNLSSLRPFIRNKEKILRAANNDPLPSPTASTLHESHLLPLPPPPSGSTPTKRRSKVPNTDRRNTDIEFATEIGQGLLSEVRKMQALLQEKEEKLRILETQKADLEKAAEAMLKQMHQIEENEEKLKEANWNLECKNEELTTSIHVLQTNLTKANTEQNKLAKQVDKLRAEIEQLHDREEKLMATMDQMKLRHEQDMSSIRRQTALIQREKADQSKQIEMLNSELAIAKSKSRIMAKPAIVDNTMLTHQATDINEHDASGDLTTASNLKQTSLPPQPPPGQTVPLETYNMMLARAHRIIMNHRVEIKEDKAEKKEMRKLLRQLQEKVERFQNDPRLWEDTVDGRSSSRSANKPSSRRLHKVSSSTKPRMKKKRRGHSMKCSNKKENTVDDEDDDGDNDSLFSYSTIGSLSDSSEESEDDTGARVKSHDTTQLKSSNEISQKSVGVDAETNTDPLDELEPLLSTNMTIPMPRSLGDELSMALSQSSPLLEEEHHTPVRDVTTPFNLNMNDTTGIEVSTQTVLEPGIEIALQTEALLTTGHDALIQTEALLTTGHDVLIQTNISTPSPVEVSVQTENSQSTLEIATQTDPSVLVEQEELIVVNYEPMTTSLEVTSQDVFSIEPEDPSVAQAALASAVAEARLASLEAAIDCSVQCEVDLDTLMSAAIAEARLDRLKVAIDHETQYELDMTPSSFEDSSSESAVDCGVQCEETFMNHDTIHLSSSGLAIDSDTQYEPISTIDLGTQYDIVERKDSEVQCVSPESNDIGVQCDDELVAVPDLSTDIVRKESNIKQLTDSISDPIQIKPVVTYDHETQYDRSIGIDNGTQSEFTELGVQAGVNTHVETKDAQVQYEQSIPHGAIDISVSSDEDEFYDATSDIKRSSKNTMRHISSIGAVSLGIADEKKRDSSVGGDDSSTLPPTSRQTESDYSLYSAKSTFSMPNEAPVSIKRDSAIMSDTTAEASMAVFEKQPSLLKTETVVNRDMTSSPVSLESDPSVDVPLSENDEIRNPVFNRIKPTQTRYYTTTDEFDFDDSLKNESIPQEEASDEKLYTKQELDQLIASAVTLALANAASNNTSPQAETANDIIQAPHSTATTTTTTAAAITAPEHVNKEEEEEKEEEEFGSVIVHVPSEHISVHYDEEHHKSKQFIDLLQDSSTQQDNDTASDQGSIEEKQSLKELSMGPSTVFEQEPAENTTSSLVIHEDTDIPTRPSNPPPTELLNRAINSTYSVLSLNSSVDHPHEEFSHSDMNSSKKAERSLSLSSVSSDNTHLRSATSVQYPNSSQVDPAISLVTHTMIGDWLWKYTRRAVGGGFSEFRHQRYFWIHPYTRTLYWSATTPGIHGNESNVKNALIENISIIHDTSNANGLPDVSLLIQTSRRNLKITAPTIEKHQIWFESISYLLTRNGHSSSIGLSNPNDKSRSISSSVSLLNRPNFRRLHDIFQPPTVSLSTPSMLTSITGNDDDEALEDVRMCCNGKHHVSKLEKDHTHRHRYRRIHGTISTIG
ncbi:uncharacterized protein BX663DRAFT_483805 [Cokeromyces recurvatus]|uniref:uncharacterized protein n=1 Tax=Cokeromyces recurvatus TaxID=90255 RepID=UPI00221EFF32|nr:uncharacterized protein BX663DRAFT_483805 [Cokeromyces recurvatus]KAI7906179.1 hypothetical protein BX663DRAFT_483805 [Cokeromyces recurvatus]